jgi:hypothetical protein
MTSSKQLPQWMMERLSRIATEIDIWTFEQETISILATEIRNYSYLAEFLPIDFREKVKAQKPRELSFVKRASIIITAYDWKAVCDVWKSCTIEEKVAAQFNTLSFALQQGASNE